MRDPARIDRILNKIRGAWHASPDQRLVQLLCNLTRDVSFFIEDDILEEDLNRHIANGCEWTPRAK